VAGDSPFAAARTGQINVPGQGEEPIRRAEQLFQENYQDIFAYCLRRSTNAEDARDAVAEVFSTTWKRIGDIPLPPDDRPWLFGVARRVVSRQRRGNQRRSDLVDRLKQMRPRHSSDEPGNLVEMVSLAISRLPRKDREALEIVMWDQLTRDEAASVLGCSRAALDVRLHRARKRLEGEITGLQRSTLDQQGDDFHGI
jgi:RNA polymerase sigma-70 factor (ECF subfamily)